MPANIRHKHTIKSHANVDGNLNILLHIGRECKTDLPAEHQEAVLVRRDWAGRNRIRGRGARAEKFFTGSRGQTLIVLCSALRFSPLARPVLSCRISVGFVSLVSASGRISVGFLSFSVGLVSD